MSLKSRRTSGLFKSGSLRIFGSVFSDSLSSDKAPPSSRLHIVKESQKPKEPIKTSQPEPPQPVTQPAKPEEPKKPDTLLEAPKVIKESEKPLESDTGQPSLFNPLPSNAPHKANPRRKPPPKSDDDEELESFYFNNPVSPELDNQISPERLTVSAPYIHHARSSSEKLDQLIQKHHESLREEHERLDKQLLLLSPKNRDFEEHENLKRKSLLFDENGNPILEERPLSYGLPSPPTEAITPYPETPYPAEEEVLAVPTQNQDSDEWFLLSEKPIGIGQSPYTNNQFSQSNHSYVNSNQDFHSFTQSNQDFHSIQDSLNNPELQYPPSPESASETGRGRSQTLTLQNPDISSDEESEAVSVIKDVVDSSDLDSSSVNTETGHETSASMANPPNLVPGYLELEQSIAPMMTSSSSLQPSTSHFDQDSAYDFKSRPVATEIRNENRPVAAASEVTRGLTNPHMPADLRAEPVRDPVVKTARPVSGRHPAPGQKSIYVETIRERTMAANSVTGNRKWPLPMGIRPGGKKMVRKLSQFSAGVRSSMFGYKDLKHVSLPSRLLNLADDDDGDTGEGIINPAAGLLPLKKRVSLDAGGQMVVQKEDDDEEDLFKEFEEDIRAVNEQKAIEEEQETSSSSSAEYVFGSPRSQGLYNRLEGGKSLGAIAGAGYGGGLFVANPDTDSD